MISNNKILFSITALLSLFTFLACSNDSSSTSTATISGSVEEEQSHDKAKASNVEGAIVTAARVTSNGSLETIEGAEAETNASGQFSLEVDTEAAQHIVITAEKESEEWQGFLSGEVENGQSYNLKPLNTESSAEAEIFTRLVANGNADIGQKADIETVVTNETAAEIKSSSTTAGKFATGLKNSAEARAEFYQESIQDDAEGKLENTYSLLAEAQFNLEADLSSSSSVEQREEASEIFYENSVNAYLNAGLEASEGAKVIEMWSRVFVNSLTSVSSEVKDEAREKSSVLVAIAVDNAVRAEAEASGMSESSKEAIIDAGVQLRAAIKSSAGVKGEVESAFEEYHDEVRSTMEADAAFEASVVIEIDTEINSSGGAKSTFSSSISSILNAGSVFDIYSSFYSEVDSIVVEKMEGGSEISTVTEIMILINLAN